MILRELREQLAQIGTGHDHKNVEIWLRGHKSRIYLVGRLTLSGDDILMEGDLKPGSVLEE